MVEAALPDAPEPDADAEDPAVPVAVAPDAPLPLDVAVTSPVAVADADAVPSSEVMTAAALVQMASPYSARMLENWGTSEQAW